MPCYCANYYGSINCHNTVNRFGDRCKLCLALKSGASLSDGLLPEHEQWAKTTRSSEEPRMERFSRARPDLMGRSVRMESRLGH